MCGNMHNDEMVRILDLEEGSWGFKLIDETMSLRTATATNSKRKGNIVNKVTKGKKITSGTVHTMRIG